MNHILNLSCALCPMLLVSFAVQGKECGPIAIAEVEAKQAERFTGIDADGDGLILPHEWRSAKVPPPIRRDTPRRNWPQRWRYPNWESMFERLDANGNGSISREEFANSRAARQTDKERPKGKRRERAFSRLDADDDGAVTKAEFNAPVERLKALDANGDGQVDRDELGNRNRQSRKG